MIFAMTVMATVVSMMTPVILIVLVPGICGGWLQTQGAGTE